MTTPDSITDAATSTVADATGRRRRRTTIAGIAVAAGTALAIGAGGASAASDDSDEVITDCGDLGDASDLGEWVEVPEGELPDDAVIIDLDEDDLVEMSFDDLDDAELVEMLDAVFGEAFGGPMEAEMFEGELPDDAVIIEIDESEIDEMLADADGWSVVSAGELGDDIEFI
ncbi:MAG: hypothetical protein AAGG08_08450, partial [Actinomycetota bacterium]